MNALIVKAYFSALITCTYLKKMHVACLEIAILSLRYLKGCFNDIAYDVTSVLNV